MTNSVRKTSLQATAGLPATDQDQKKLQEQARNRTKNIAVGVIIGLSLATAAYLGHGYIFGKTQPDYKSRMCELPGILESGKKHKSGNLEILPSSPEYSKAYSTFLNSEDFKKCPGTIPKETAEFLTKFCEAYKTHWICV